MCAGSAQFGEVCPFGTRIGVEVFAGGKLRRVDEYGHHDPLGGSQSLFDEAQMSIMQRPHGRHQGRAHALRAPPRNPLAHRLDGADCLEGFRHLAAGIRSDVQTAQDSRENIIFSRPCARV
jgi:hypothetical protein